MHVVPAAEVDGGGGGIPVGGVAWFRWPVLGWCNRSGGSHGGWPARNHQSRNEGGGRRGGWPPHPACAHLLPLGGEGLDGCQHACPRAGRGHGDGSDGASPSRNGEFRKGRGGRREDCRGSPPLRPAHPRSAGLRRGSGSGGPSGRGRRGIGRSRGTDRPSPGCRLA
jgi:hypothetical protein